MPVDNARCLLESCSSEEQSGLQTWKASACQKHNEDREDRQGENSEYQHGKGGQRQLRVKETEEENRKTIRTG